MQSPTVVDCFMNASLAGQGSFAAIEACSRVAPWPGSKKWITKHELPELHSWHVTTQERLFDHLRQVWPDDRPRVMVDLGCHAGHGRYKNISDTLLWLQRFNSSGSLVLGVDLSEDYALDLQHRFDEVPPFSTLRGVTKRTLHTAVSYLDGKTINFKREIMMGVTCCGGEWCAVWDKLDAKRNGTYSDHYCRITRQRLHASPSTLPLPPSKYPAFWQGISQGKLARQGVRYEVHTQRADTLWRRELNSRHIDFLKIDIDLSWAATGLEGIIEKRAFSVMIIEIDEESSRWRSRWSRKAMVRAGMGNVSQVDQLLWLGWRHGYRGFLKVPCCAKPEIQIDATLVNPRDAASYFPLTDPAALFQPSGIDLHVSLGSRIQDLMLIDASETHAIATLQKLGDEGCHTKCCCCKHWRKKAGFKC
jgi:hypothetical protein